MATTDIAVCILPARFHRSRFTGKERDTESGNDYFGARYYASSMGRFMSPDWSAKVEPVPYSKLDDPQSLNLYSYVGNNPLSAVDPDGHCSKSGDTTQNEQCSAENAADKVNALNDWISGGGASSRPGDEAAQQHTGSDQPSSGTQNGKPLSAYPKGSKYCGDFVCTADGKTHLGVAPNDILGVTPEASIGDALMFIPIEKVGAITAAAISKAGGEVAAKAAEAFFNSGTAKSIFGKGTWMNSGQYFRIGFSRLNGTRVFRIGGKLILNQKIDLWKGGPL